jgi:ubiquinone/menaquinone biosynthesis C-methylase UbiE
LTDKSAYVHGYSTVESRRLADQAGTLAHLLHHDSIFPPGSRVLEAGCGVGAQTVILAPQNPECSFTSIDISPKSIAAAQKLIKWNGVENVCFQVADILNLQFPAGSFDHISVCFVLEPLSGPARALKSLRRVLKKGGR